MTRPYDDFMKVLALAMGWSGDSLPPMGADRWQAVYSIARRHAVQGIMFDAVEALPAGSGLPLDLSARWMLEVRSLEANSQHMEAVVARQRQTWAKHGVDAVLLKGLEVAAMYPHPRRRVCGDIDWWMRSQADWDKALEVLRSNGIAWEMDSDGDIHYTLAGVVIEHHHEGLEDDGPEGVLLLLNEHILHHALVMGIGMRQLCDYAAALKWYEGRFDKVHYAAMLRSRGLSKWTSVLEGSLGLAGAPFAVRYQRLSRMLLDLVMSDGNMGLDKSNRYGGLVRRMWLFMRVCPGALVRRWCSLVLGRLKRK